MHPIQHRGPNDKHLHLGDKGFTTDSAVVFNGNHCFREWAQANVAESAGSLPSMYPLPVFNLGSRSHSHNATGRDENGDKLPKCVSLF